MIAAIKIFIAFLPLILSVVYPFIRTFRTGLWISSYFICWLLLIIWTFIFVTAVPSAASWINKDWGHDMLHWMPNYPNASSMVVFGWIFPAIPILLALVFRPLFNWVGSRRSDPNPQRPAERHVPAIALLSLVAIVELPFAYLDYTRTPPHESTLLNTFYTHRQSFERMRDLLQADNQVSRIGTWGVDVSDTGISKPPEGNFPAPRFHEYTELLKNTGTGMVSREDGPSPEMHFVIWGSGFGGYTLHVAISWVPVTPQRQVSDLDLYCRNFQSSGTSGLIYRHIEGNWYLSTDIGAK